MKLLQVWWCEISLPRGQEVRVIITAHVTKIVERCIGRSTKPVTKRGTCVCALMQPRTLWATKCIAEHGNEPVFPQPDLVEPG